MKKLLVLGFAFLLIACSAGAPDSDAKKLPKKKINTQKQIPKKSVSDKTLKKILMQISSSAFSHNGNIPEKYTCDGDNVSPPLSWSDVPGGTKSFVLIHDDPDAIPVAGYVWDHWILMNIPPETREIPEKSKAGVEMRNSFQQTSYGGPCPPNGEHKYFFKLYALDTTLSIPGKSLKKDIEKAMEGHILAKTELIGKYNRKK